MMDVVRTHLLDATALISMALKETYTDRLLNYISKCSVLWTTSLCFAEALRVLKRKRNSKTPTDKITEQEYFMAVEELLGLCRNGSISFEDVDYAKYDCFVEAESMVKKHEIDFVDAFQIVTIKKGLARFLAGESQTMLITADSGLAEAARRECIRVWCFSEEELPQGIAQEPAAADGSPE